jgi:hypothetical protein
LHIPPLSFGLADLPCSLLSSVVCTLIHLSTTLTTDKHAVWKRLDCAGSGTDFGVGWTLP